MTTARMWITAALVCAGAAATGCQNKLHDENQALWKQNRELQARLNDASASKADSAQLAQYQQQLADRDAKIAELQAQLRQPTPGTNSPGIAGIETSYDAKAGTMTVNLPGDVLFDSGRATLKESAKATLNKIASALRKDYSGKKVMIVGHTDSDPISRTKDKWEDNLDLSAGRARTVSQYLISQGVSSHLIGLRAYGNTAPRSNKSASRRVEIVVAMR
jgi:chemotaxis protein MotB